ncbi:hypothetical protein EYF80_022810 [Liparis tanakae]|uniref:Uncharacterized protein n=1 Tax=Liparis tanakae TaxID=230148 RepID=A0A4Z2HMQ7_9TELE|nr:hypothetical protein EYF80_022810 [Liparis tanakae]
MERGAENDRYGKSKEGEEEPLRPARQQEAHRDFAKASAASPNSLHLGERVTLDVVGGSARGGGGGKENNINPQMKFSF